MFKWFADLITYQVLSLEKGSRVAESVNFFFYDLPKVYFLLISVIFVVAIIRTFLPYDKIKQIINKKCEIFGNLSASFIGIFAPFCTCSAIPMFLGMLEAGIPLGVTMSFLIASPTINEIAVVLLLGLFGWKVMVTYILSGMFIATTAGYIIGRLKMEKFVDTGARQDSSCSVGNPTYDNWKDRFIYAYSYTKDVFLYVWLYVMIGIAIGALIHGYIPVDFVSHVAGDKSPLSVIIAVIIGVPIYANCAGALPVVQAILEKGMPLGTALAFMMAVTALSLPEFMILRRVMRPKLLYTFFGTVAAGIILIGWLFNLIF